MDMKNMEMMVRLYHHFPRCESPDFRRCGFLFALVLIDWQLSGLFLRPDRLCPDSASCKLLLCRARSLSGPPLPRFRHPTCFLPSGLLTSWAPPTPIPRPASFSSVGLDRFRGASRPDPATRKLLLCRARSPPMRLPPRFYGPHRFKAK